MSNMSHETPEQPGFIDDGSAEYDFRAIERAEATQQREAQTKAEALTQKNLRQAQGLGMFGTGLGLLFGFFLFAMVVEAVFTLSALSQVHPWLGWAAGILLGFALVLLVFAILGELRAGADLRTSLKSAENLKQAAKTSSFTQKDVSRTLAHVRRLARNRNHPCHEELQQTLLQLETLHSTGHSPETQMQLIETSALRPLDRQVQQEVRHAFATSAWTTIASPFAILDAGLTLHRALILTRRIALVYGGVPSSLASTFLLRRTFQAMVIAGTMEAGDALLTNLFGGSFLAKMSTKLGEGVVTGVLIARLGLSAQQQLRPLPFMTQNQPGLPDMTPDLIENLINRGDQR